MEGTYCGKDCAACLYREAENCPGCKLGPGSMSGNCGIARCCRDKGHSNCESCTFSEGCALLRSAPMEPEYRAGRRRAAEELRGRIGRDAPLLASKLNTLFVLLLVSTMVSVVISILSNFHNQGIADTLGSLVSFGVGVAYGCILLTLGGVNRRFKLAGIMHLAGIALSCAGDLLAFMPFLALILLIPAVPLGIMSCRYEFYGYAEALHGLNDEQGRKWRVLWVVNACTICVTAAGAVFAFVTLGLAALLVLVGAVAALVVYIIQLVYLNRTVKVFEAVAKSQ